MGRYRLQDLFSVPGLLSLSRLPLAALFPFVVDEPPVAFSLLVVAGLTDVLDGWYARRFGKATPTGAVIDPLTDKLFVGVVVLTFLLTGRFGLRELLLLSTREIGEFPLVFWWAASRAQRRRKADQPRPNLPGKLSTAMQFIAIGSVLLKYGHSDLLLIAAAAVGSCAAAFYWIRELSAARAERNQERNRA